MRKVVLTFALLGTICHQSAFAVPDGGMPARCRDTYERAVKSYQDPDVMVWAKSLNARADAVAAILNEYLNTVSDMDRELFRIVSDPSNLTASELALFGPVIQKQTLMAKSIRDRPRNSQGGTHAWTRCPEGFAWKPEPNQSIYRSVLVTCHNFMTASVPPLDSQSVFVAGQNVVVCRGPDEEFDSNSGHYFGPGAICANTPLVSPMAPEPFTGLGILRGYEERGDDRQFSYSPLVASHLLGASQSEFVGFMMARDGCDAPFTTE